MIEFDGYINGVALKRFWHNNRIMGMKIITVACLLVFPAIVVWGIKEQNQLMVIFPLAALVLIPLCALLPQGKKTETSVTPKKIVVEDDCIRSTTDTTVDVRFVADVKQVNDFGEFYELVFPFGKVSPYFICQKNLLTKGTLEEFEALFEGKITKLQ